jgi:flagellar basal-body rod modification protein FlgD
MSTVSAVSSNSSATNAAQTSTLPEKTLSQNDFFKLLITQMTSQDPMNPLSNAEFMGQMAQFSSLEQSKTLSADISKMRSEQQLLQANTLIGRDVDVTTSEGLVTTGTVTGVAIDNGTPQVIVNGASYGMDKILTIAPAGTAASN